MTENSSILQKILKQTLRIVCFFISIIIYLILTIPYLFILILTKIIQFAIDFKNLKFLVGDDAMLGFNNVNGCVINVIMMVENVITAETIKKIFTSKVINANGPDGQPMFPKFNYKLVKHLGYLFWSKSQNFNIDEHVSTYSRKDGQIPDSKSQLKSIINEIINVPLPLDKPPWEIVLISYENNTCVLLRVHHTVTDGLSLFRLITEVICGQRDAYGRFLTKMSSKFQEKQYKNALKTGFISICKLISMIIKAPIVTIQQGISRDKRNLLHGPKLTGETLYDWTCAAKLSELRRIKEVTQSTVNDVIMSCLAGALNRYIFHRGGCPPDIVHALVPVSFQSPNDPIEMKNHLTVIYPQLPTGDLDCLQRLRKTKQIMDKIKCSPIMTINRWSIQMFINTIPYFIMKPIIVDGMQSVATVLCSNKPGPTAAISLNEQQVSSMFSTPQIRGSTGLGICICSYIDDLMVSMAVDKAIIDNKDDLHFLLKCFKNEIRILLKEIETQHLSRKSYIGIKIPEVN